MICAAVRYIVAAAVLALGSLSSLAVANPNNYPAGPLKYDLRLGALDVDCYPGSELDERFDTDAKVLEATLEFLKMPESLHKDASTVLATVVKTKMTWVGQIEKGTGMLAFQSQRTGDMANEGWAKLGAQILVLVADRVEGEYVKGTIHGRLKTEIRVAALNGVVADCSGEASILMLPKE